MSVTEYYVHARAFLARAQELLKRFDEGNEAALFYGALELRMGIEARLHECLKASWRQLGHEQQKLKEYKPEKLLGELARVNPASFESVQLRFSSGSSQAMVLTYEPLSQDLAKYYGRLNALLHYTFFESHPYWYHDRSTDPANPRTLSEYREFLGTVAAELDRVTGCQLLCAPRALVDFLRR